MTNDLKITFLGHSTVMIEDGTTVLLTDPIFSRHLLGLNRHTPFPCDPASLPDPTAVLVSHAHYDHLDLPTFKYFSGKTVIVLPVGLGKWMGKFSPNPMVELMPGDSEEISADLRVTAFPVAHTGWRLSGLRFRNCNGYLIKIGGKTIFFPGDTGYDDFRPALNLARAERIDVALLPIGAYRPEWMMRKRHLNPPEALQVFEEINARVMIPIHWGTFRISSEPLDEPIAWLSRLAEERRIADRIKILQPGESGTY